MIGQYLRTRYVRGARGPAEFDCWGLVRSARFELFGRPWLPLLADAAPGNLRAITRAHSDVSALHGFREVAPHPGVIATAWAASLCVHVGIVVQANGRLMILETDEPTGPCLTSINKFTARYTRALFYDDQDLPGPDAKRAG